MMNESELRVMWKRARRAVMVFREMGIADPRNVSWAGVKITEQLLCSILGEKSLYESEHWNNIMKFLTTGETAAGVFPAEPPSEDQYRDN